MTNDFRFYKVAVAISASVLALVGSSCKTSSSTPHGANQTLNLIRIFPDINHYMKTTDALEMQFSTKLDASQIHAGSDCVHLDHAVEASGAIPMSVSLNAAGDTVVVQPNAPLDIGAHFSFGIEPGCLQGEDGSTLFVDVLRSINIPSVTSMVYPWVPITGNPGLSETIFVPNEKPFVAVKADGSSVLAANMGDRVETNRVIVVHETATGWETLGDSATNPGTTVYALAIGADDQPVLAYSSALAEYGIGVKKWDGTTWNELGHVIPNDYLAAGGSLAFDHDGNPLLGWGSSAGDHARVAKWNGSTWDLLGGTDGVAPGASAPSIAVAHDGTIFVAVRTYGNGAWPYLVSKWSGSAWEAVGTLPPGFGNQNAPSLVVDATGAPLIGFFAEVPGARTFKVLRFDGSAWMDLGGATLPSTLSLANTGSLVSNGSHLAVNRGADNFTWSGTSWVATQPLGVDDQDNSAFATTHIALTPSGEIRATQTFDLFRSLGMQGHEYDVSILVMKQNQ